MIYKNEKIFRDLGDYILGGFTQEQLAKLKIIGEDDEITENKLIHFCKERLARALKIYFIKAYREYLYTYDIYEARVKTYEQIRGLIYEYLNINLASATELDVVAEAIYSSDYYQKWQIDFIENFNYLSQSVMRVDISPTTESGIDVGDSEIEESVENPDIIQILEQISE